MSTGTKLFEIYTTDKSFISLIYKKLPKIEKKNATRHIKKLAGNMNREFTKNRRYIALKHMERCSSSFRIREM